MIYQNKESKSVQEIIKEIQKLRPGSLNKEKYVNFCHRFQNCNTKS